MIYVNTKITRIFSAILVGLIFAIFSFIDIPAQDNGAGEEEAQLVTDGKSAILIEPTTFAVIYEKNADDRRHPASMTKIMTMILIMEAVKKGVISFDDTLYARYASSMGGIIYSNWARNESQDLLKSIAINSANDSSVVRRGPSAAASEISSE